MTLGVTPADVRARVPLWVWDLLALALLTAIGLWVWRLQWSQVGGAVPAGSPFWACARDHRLYGPDAEMWASNAWAVHLGRWEDVDVHRLPTWCLLTAAMLQFVPNVALAGHLVNHLLQVALPLVLYGAGLAMCGRAAAFGAAVNVALLSELVMAAETSSADPAIAIALPLALLGGALAARHPRLSALGGALAALGALAHLSTLGDLAPGLVLAWGTARPGRDRWVSAAGFLGGALLLMGLIGSHYPFVTGTQLVDALAEGVAPNAVERGGTGGPALRDRALAVVGMGFPTAPRNAVLFTLKQIRPRWMPWDLALTLPWIGALGLFLPGRAEGASGSGARTLPWSGASRVVNQLAPGVALLGGLAPMIAFAAVRSPDRYSVPFLPVTMLLGIRGAASLLAGVEFAVRRGLLRLFPSRSLPGWPLALLTLALGLGWAKGVWDPRWRLLVGSPPPNDGGAATIGKAILDHFPPGGRVATTNRGAAAFAGRKQCMLRAPMTVDGSALALEQECPGEGDIPYVVSIPAGRDDRTEARKGMDAWVERTFPVVEKVQNSEVTATVYAVPRSQGPS